ncbi:MAG TPA: TRAM domain-containing protein [archaeon]|nr:TRAM domain-containing protein [archaeon]
MPFGDRRGGGGFRRGGPSRGGGRFGGGGGGSRGFGGRPSGGPRFERRDQPVKVGEEYDVDITDVSARGDGIARVKNFVVFVPGTSKGDKVRIRIKELRGTSAIGEIVGGESSGEERSEEVASEEKQGNNGEENESGSVVEAEGGDESDENL